MVGNGIYILVLAVLVAGSSGFAGSVQTEDPLDLELKLLCDKNEYLYEEAIWIDILLINPETDPVKVNYPSPDLDRLEGLEGEASTARLDTLQAVDKPFRLRMIARTIQRGLPML